MLSFPGKFCRFTDSNWWKASLAQPQTEPGTESERPLLTASQLRYTENLVKLQLGFPSRASEVARFSPSTSSLYVLEIRAPSPLFWRNIACPARAAHVALLHNDVVSSPGAFFACVPARLLVSRVLLAAAHGVVRRSNPRWQCRQS